MPTVIDSLIVALRLDPNGQFKKDTQRVNAEQKAAREQTLKGAKELEGQFRKTADGVLKVRRELLSMLTAFTAGAGLTQFINNTITADAATGRMARQIGLATDELSAWQGVLKRNGGSAEAATSGLQTITKAFEDIQLTGQSGLIPFFQLLGIRMEDLQNPSETLLKLADQFSRMDPRRAAALGAGVGLSPEFISVLSQGRSAVQRMLEEQRRLGVTTERDAKMAQRLQDSLQSLSAASARIGRNILQTLAPVLEKVGDLLQDLAVWAQHNGPVIQAAIAGIAVAMGILAAETVIATWPILAIAAAFAGLAYVFNQLYEDYQKWANGGPSTFDWSGVVDGVASLKGAFGELSGALAEATKAFNDMIAAVPPEWWDYLLRGLEALASLLITGVKASIDNVTGALVVLKDTIKIVADLLRGDFSQAWRDTGKLGSDVIDQWRRRLGSFGEGVRRAAGAFTRPRNTSAPARAGTTSGGALGMIRGHEGFREKAYWDRNAWRVGFGSDTVTDPKTGRVTRVTRDTTVTRAQAEADLQRRVRDEFGPRAAAQVGAKWNSLPQATRDALTSVAYNYGKLPANVVAAARTGDNGQIANAVEALKVHNEGINAGRRMAEANAIRQAGAVQQNAAVVASNARVAPAPPVNDNRASTVNIGTINVQTQATDAQGMASGLRGALQQRGLVAQSNGGLG